MSELFDDGAEGNTLEDFWSPEDSNDERRITPAPSITNQAAFITAMDPSLDLVNTFQKVENELAMGAEGVGSEIVSTSLEVDDASEVNAITNILGQSELDIDTKEKVVNSLATRTNDTWKRIRTLVGENATIADSANETPEAEASRVDVGTSLDKVFDYQIFLQRLENTERAKNNPNIANKVASFAEIILPFVEQSELASVINKIKGGDASAGDIAQAMTLMGEAKEEIRQGLSQIPWQQKQAAAEAVAGILSDHPGILFSEQNDLVRIDLLNSFLKTGYYTDIDRYADDVISLLDMSVIFAPLVKPIKGVLRARRAAKAGQGAKEVFEPLTDAQRAIQDDILSVGKKFEDKQKARQDFNEGLIPDVMDPTPRGAHTPITTAVDETGGSAKFIGGKEQSGSQQGLVAQDFGGSERVLPQVPDVPRSGETTDFVVRDDGIIVPLYLLREGVAESIARTRHVASEVQPTTVSQVFKEVNPEKARALHQAASDDVTGGFAKVTYGANRTEAVVNDMVGTPANKAGSVPNKIPDPDRNIRERNLPDPHVRDAVLETGDSFYTIAEKARARARFITDFQNSVNLTRRANMETIEHTPTGVKIKGVFGPEEGGYRSAEEAREILKYNLRHLGIDDEEITLLKKHASGEYLPVKKGDDLGEGDYLGQVATEYKFRADDVFEEFDVKNNWFDYLPALTQGKAGSLQRILLDPASMLHPILTKAASSAGNRSIGLEKTLSNLSTDFAKGFAKLKADRADLMFDFIKRANHENLTINRTNMQVHGLSESEMDLMYKWKDSWDNIYWLENRDLVKTLRNRGYGMLVDNKTNTRLFARKVAHNQLKGHNNGRKTVDYYDAETDSIKTLSSDEVSKLYADGGFVAEMRTPMKVEDDATRFIISRETPSSYIRELKDTDQVLHYRQGYYQVNYKDPWFIDRIVTDKRGNELYRQAVATSSSTKDAQLMARRLGSTDAGGYKYVARRAKEQLSVDSDDYFNMAIAQGRTAQRVRGERLSDATAPITDGLHGHIMDPVESLTKSIRSISRRVSMRDFLESAKTRFEKQFDDIIPKNAQGMKKSFEELNRKDFNNPEAGMIGKAADARTTFEYIQYLENGYINSIDDAYKLMLQEMANLAGEAKYSRVEAALRAASEADPTHLGKSAAFKLYLALNPLRQFVVQSHQAVRLFAMNPGYWASQAAANDATLLAAGMRGLPFPKWALKGSGMTEQQAAQMVKDFRNSGLWAAVDANNLVRHDLRKLAETTLAGKIKDVVDAPIRGAQRIGFDAGEQINITSAWLTFRKRAIDEHGIDKLDAAIMDDVVGQARNFTYNMDFAGDMPYNRNMLNTVFQFLQVPHKAFTQVTFNRQLSGAQKTRLALYDLMMWGVPGTAAGGLFYSMLPQEDGFVRDVVTRGFESWAINSLFQTLADDDTDINFNGLAPYELAGVYKVITNLWLGPGAALAESPIGQLATGRVANSLITAANYFNFIDDQPPTSFFGAARSFAELSSGASNLFKSYAMMKYAQKESASGVIVDKEVTSLEAIAQAFGFQTIDETNYWAVTKEVFEQSKEFKETVTDAYKMTKMLLGKEGMSIQDVHAQQQVLQHYWFVLGNGNPRAMEIIKGLIKRDVQDGDFRIFNNIMKLDGFTPPSELKQLLRDHQGSEEMIQHGMKMLDDMEKWRQEEGAK